MRIFKRILKFIIESSVIILITYSVFKTGSFVKAKKDAKIAAQQQSQAVNNETNQNANNQNQQTQQQTNVKMTKEQLDDAFAMLLDKYQTNSNEIGFVYKNFSTGYRYSQNDNKYFVGASTTKLIYAMHIYDRMQKGELDENTEVAYDPKFLQDGGGEITNQPKKDSYPLEYVLKNMIQYSDNTATEMLMINPTNAMNVKVNYLAKLGATYPAKQANENLVSPGLMELVWTKLYDNRADYKQLLTYLQNSNDNEWIKQGIPNKTIASKYGAYETYAHDTAIVFGDKDYLLIIYTNNVKNSGQVIKQLANEINSLTDNNM